MNGKKQKQTPVSSASCCAPACWRTTSPARLTPRSPTRWRALGRRPRLRRPRRAPEQVPPPDAGPEARARGAPVAAAERPKPRPRRRRALSLNCRLACPSGRPAGILETRPAFGNALFVPDVHHAAAPLQTAGAQNEPSLSAPRSLCLAGADSPRWTKPGYCYKTAQKERKQGGSARQQMTGWRPAHQRGAAKGQEPLGLGEGWGRGPPQPSGTDARRRNAGRRARGTERQGGHGTRTRAGAQAGGAQRAAPAFVGGLFLWVARGAGLAAPRVPSAVGQRLADCGWRMQPTALAGTLVEGGFGQAFDGGGGGGCSGGALLFVW